VPSVSYAHDSGRRCWAPLAMGLVLMGVGIMKAMMSWSLVPIWYHVMFAALLRVMAMVGGRAKAAIRTGGL